ncbi:MAG TPA: hypothetical protein VJ743_07730 [Albitalea sp.]|nr:hypothetical protein [Albitalea sp.]
MNRFLAGLVDRAEGRAPVLHRRPRALFEPAAGDGPGLGLFEQNLANASATASARQVGDRAEPAPPAPGRSHDPRAGERSAVRAEQRDLPRAALLPEAAPTRRMPVAAPSHAERQPPHAAMPEPQQARPLQVIATQTVLRELRPAAPATFAPQGPASARRADVPAPPAASPSPRQLDRTPAPPAAVLLAKAQSLAVVRHERQPRAVPAPVQISIGRVEVRAVGTSGERGSRASGPSAPRLSLDDYLRQRNGASR